jgi:chemotaxis methyl-accepting protein methylase
MGDASPDVSDDIGFASLLDKVARERSFACASYKERCLRRRIAVRMRARGVHTYDDYAAVLDRDPGEYDRLIDALTINVTRFFRDRNTFDAIGRLVVPELWSFPLRTIEAWSAGCASGEEPYTLALLFLQHAESVGGLAELPRIQITATDIDRESLETARGGRYGEPSFVETPPDVRERYFGHGAPHEIDPRARGIVRFVRRDLVAEPPPGNAFRLIVCRNVLIYFDRDTQESLFGRFHDALAPGGFLVLGKVETLLGPARAMFTPVDQRERIFRRR